MTNSRNIFWLKIASAMTIGFGVMLAAAAFPPLAAPTQFFADIILSPLGEAQDLSAHTTRLISAICGGVMAGWGVLFWMIATRLVGKEPALARQFILGSIFTWFVIDSTCSVLAGAPLNVIGNVPFLLIFAIPAWGLKA